MHPFLCVCVCANEMPIRKPTFTERSAKKTGRKPFLIALTLQSSNRMIQSKNNGTEMKEEITRVHGEKGSFDGVFFPTLTQLNALSIQDTYCITNN